MSKSLSLLLSATLFAGCAPKTTSDQSDTGAATSGSAGGGSAGGGGAGGGGAGGGGSATTIYDVQMGEYSEGTVVTINDAVVTTQLTDGDNPAFFIQSMEGGAYNGIYIFKYDEVDYSPTPGDVISITGEYTEYYGNSQLKVTEAGAITVTDTGAEIVVTDVTEEPENWEMYESVMVRFTDMEITNAADLYNYGTVDLAIGCSMDNLFTNYDAEDGATYASITGPITYGWDIYAIVPRTGDDLVGYSGGTGGGSGDEVCDDGADNDGDGYIDCDDWDCDDDPACGGSGGGSGDEVCDDGADNDADGYTDCEDWDCDDDPACEGASGSDEVCDDGADNDGDSYIDCDDFDCADDDACAEDCDDGIDNDADGYTDCDDFYCDEDPACL